jgi:hypothetical protein
MKTNKIISNIKSELGEGVYYDNNNDFLLWVDINKLKETIAYFKKTL